MDAIRTAELKRRVPRWALTAANVATRAYALATVPDRPMPDFLIIGTKRGGTTSLFNYLVQHPGIFGLFPQVRGKKSTDAFFADNGHSMTWYRSHFHTETRRRLKRRSLGYRPLSMEVSPFYVWDPRIAPRVAEVAPHVKAIVLLRDPVARAWSHYQERVQNGVEPLEFLDALAAEGDRLAGELDRMLADPTYHSTSWDWYSYKSRGEYVDQLTHWTRHFPTEQLLVLFSEDLYADPQGAVDRVATFLDVPSFQLPTTRAYNATWRTRDRAPAEAVELLTDHFAEPNRRLSAWLGRDLPWS